MWLNVAIAAVLLVITVTAMYLVLRRLKAQGVAADDIKPLRASASELEALIAAYQRDRQVGGAGTAASVAVAGASRPAVPAAATLPAVAMVKPKAQFLSGPNKLLYLVLKTALPDHPIFVNVRLADALQIASQPATPQQRAQLAQARMDFVICNKALAIVAMLDITDGNRADDVLKRQIEPQLAAAGGRYLRVAPNAIPKPAEARALVYGE
jgi:hypothetical protein